MCVFWKCSDVDMIFFKDLNSPGKSVDPIVLKIAGILLNGSIDVQPILTHF
jgi:hypothetical protein